MSPRNLTRLFKETTGHTAIEFKHEVKFEWAKTLLNNPEYTIGKIAGECGFDNPCQFRRIWKDIYGKSMAEHRTQNAS